MSQDPQAHPEHGWVRWFAEQWALFVVLGVVAGAMFWVARQALMAGIVVGCFAFFVGCFIGLKRLDRSHEVVNEHGMLSRPWASVSPTKARSGETAT